MLEKRLVRLIAFVLGFLGAGVALSAILSLGAMVEIIAEMNIFDVLAEKSCLYAVGAIITLIFWVVLCAATHISHMIIEKYSDQRRSYINSWTMNGGLLLAATAVVACIVKLVTGPGMYMTDYVIIAMACLVSLLGFLASFCIVALLTKDVANKRMREHLQENREARVKTLIEMVQERCDDFEGLTDEEISSLELTKLVRVLVEDYLLCDDCATDELVSTLYYMLDKYNEYYPDVLCDVMGRIEADYEELFEPETEEGEEDG